MMLTIDDQDALVLFRFDRYADGKERLRLQIRLDGGSLAGEYVVSVSAANVHDGEASSDLREFADAIDAAQRLRKPDLGFLDVPLDDPDEVERNAAIASIDEGFRKLAELAEKSRVRRVLHPQPPMRPAGE